MSRPGRLPAPEAAALQGGRLSGAADGLPPDAEAAGILEVDIHAQRRLPVVEVAVRNLGSGRIEEDIAEVRVDREQPAQLQVGAGPGVGSEGVFGLVRKAR